MFGFRQLVREPERDCVVPDQSQRLERRRGLDRPRSIQFRGHSLLPTRCDWSGTTQSRSSFFGSFVCLFLLMPLSLCAVPTALDEDAPWPRVRSTNGNTVTLHLPQVEQWTSNWFRARAVVEVKPAESKKSLTGVAWFEAKGSVDRSNRLVTLDRIEITRANFPDAPNGGSNALAAV